MTSERKIAANRDNARKSTGPRTRRGKARASRNSIRHGLEAANFGDPGICEKVERIAKILCQGRPCPFLYEQAIIIAESQVLLARVRAARIAAIERMRKPTWREPPLLPGFPTRDELDGIIRDFDEGKLRKVIKTVTQMTLAIKSATKVCKLAAERGAIDQPLTDAYRQAWAREEARVKEVRDDVACVCHALPEILRLERYERRALSRRRQALRKFNARTVIEMEIAARHYNL